MASPLWPGILRPLLPGRAALLALGASALALGASAQDAVAPAPAAPPFQSQQPSQEGLPCDAVVWCGLFLASDTAGEEESDLPVVARLRKAFPDGRGFRLIGESTERISKEYERWIVPSKQLFLKVDSLGCLPGKKGVQLHLQLWQEGNVLLKTDAILRREPVFISGPRRGGDQLIMVLELVEEAEEDEEQDKSGGRE